MTVGSSSLKAVPQRRGFVLIIVIALLGVMAYLALDFASRSSLSRMTSRNHVEKSRSRLYARSGFEAAQRRLVNGKPFGPDGEHRSGLLLLCGTTADAAIYGIHDQSGALNINDGISAGMAEVGAAYRANFIDLDPAPYDPDPPVLKYAHPNGFWCVDAPPSFDPTHVVLRGGSLSTPGDVVLVKGNGPNKGRTFVVVGFLGFDPDYALPWAQIATPAAFSAGYEPYELWNKLPPGPPPKTRSNLRIRNLLNAYGDVHRFLAALGQPGASNYGQPFAISDTATADFGHSMPSFHVVTGQPLTDLAQVAQFGSGLGDRIVASRPQGGYAKVRDIEGLVDKWAQDRGIPPQYFKEEGGFFHKIRWDLTTRNHEDPTFCRLAIRQGVSATCPDVTEFGTRDTTQFPLPAPPNLFSPMHLDARPPDMQGIFKSHPVSLLNLNGASHAVRAAVFAALVNVGYLCEGSRSLLYNNDDPLVFEKNVAMAQGSIGVSGPVLRNSLMENGVVNPANRNKFMSLRDALILAQSFEDYRKSFGYPRNTDMFRDLLRWKEQVGVPYEKCEPSGTPFDPGTVTGGWFPQDYVSSTLPHALGGLRRLPGYMGAPQALLSPYVESRGFEPSGIPGDHVDIADYAKHSGTHPTWKTEDFVSRELLPKVSFVPTGLFIVEASGHVRDPKWQALASTRLEVRVSGPCHMKTLRSQQDFVLATDSASTSPKILMGPESTRSPHYPHTHLGMVGLRDFEEPVPGNPQLVAHFNGHVTGDPGTSRMFAVSPDAPVGYKKTSLPTNGVFCWDDAAGTYASPTAMHVPHEGVEWATTPLFRKGSKGSNLSPFGGVWLSSMENGVSSKEAWGQAKDLLYWRLFHVGDALSPLQETLPTGTTLGKGHLSFWFRIPATHRGVDDPLRIDRLIFGEWRRVDARMQFRALAHLSVWETVEHQPGLYASRPTNIIVGTGFDDQTGRTVVLARHITGAGLDNASSHYSDGWNRMHYHNGYHQRKNPFVAAWDPLGYAANPTGMILSHPLLADYTSTWDMGLDDMRINERWVVLKDDILLPECGPGSWHKISVGWNNQWPEPDPLRRFWLRLHDASNAESYGEKSWNLLENTPGDYRDFYGYHSSSSIFCLGAIYSCDKMMAWQQSGYPAPYVDVPLSGSQSGDAGALYDDDGLGYCTNRMLPSHMCDSLVDNVMVQFGSLPPGLDHFNAPGYGTPPFRYDVADEPSWVLNPRSFLPFGSKVEMVGARIFDPRDSAGNFPHVSLELLEGGVPQAVLQSHAGGNATLQRTDRIKTFPGHPVGDQTRIRLTYTDKKPDGSPLVNDGTDNVTEIPWIMEIMVLYSEANPLKVLEFSYD